MKALFSFYIRLSLILFGFQLTGQTTFSKVYEDSNVNNALSSGIVLSTLDKGFLIAGNNNLIRFDSLGNVIWSEVLGQNDFIGTIVQNVDTTYYFLTNERYTGNSIPVLTKMNAHGGLLWSKRIQYGSYQNCIPLSASCTNDSGVVICGYGSPTLQTINTFVSRFDKQGNLIWSKIISVGDTSTVYRSIKQTPDSGFIMIGSLNQNSASLIKLNKTGVVSWCKRYMPLDSLNILGVDLEVRDNKLYSYFLTDKLIFLICDLAGNFMTAKKFNTSGYMDPLSQDKSFSLNITASKGFMITKGAYAGNAFLKIDSLGNVEWNIYNFLFGNLAAAQLTDGGHILVGGGPFPAIRYSVSSTQIGVIKLDSLGNGIYCSNKTTISATSISLSAIPSGYTLTQLGSIQIASLSVSSTAITQRNGCIDSVNPGVVEYKNSSEVSIYPNPSSGIISVQIKDHYSSGLKYSILNLNGEILKEELENKNESEHKIDCSSLAPGVYILQVSGNSALIATKRLIKIP